MHSSDCDWVLMFKLHFEKGITVFTFLCFLSSKSIILRRYWLSKPVCWENCLEDAPNTNLFKVGVNNSLSVSHTRANWQAEPSTSYKLGWFSVNVFLSIRDRWEVPPKSLAFTASANDNEGSFLAGYLNCSWLRNKRVLLDTSTVHLSREQPLVVQGRACVTP